MQTGQESERWRPIHMHGGWPVEPAERSWATAARLRLRQLARGGAHQGSSEACPLGATLLRIILVIVALCGCWLRLKE
jgi:hypothetical protein